MSRNAYIVGGYPTLMDAIKMVWQLSPDREGDPLRTVTVENEDGSTRTTTPHALFMAKIGDLDPDEIEEDIKDYLAFVFYDGDTTSDKVPLSSSSMASGLVHRLCKAYGWSLESALTTKVPCALQLMERMSEEQNGHKWDTVCDAASGRMLRALNKLPLEDRKPLIDAMNRGETVELPDTE